MPMAGRENNTVCNPCCANDFFILSGMQGLKKFYLRAESRDLEVRGLTILYDQATEGIMDPVTVVMSSAFAPFTGTVLTALNGPAPVRSHRRKPGSWRWRRSANSSMRSM